MRIARRPARNSLTSPAQFYTAGNSYVVYAPQQLPPVTSPRAVRPAPSKSGYRSAWWLPGPHLATLWGKFGRREEIRRVRWETVDTPDGDFVELAHLDAVKHKRDGEFITTPHLLILHGLEGGVNSHYVRGFMREATERGWNATLLLFRTCGPTPNRLPRSYHSGETSDLQFIVERLVAANPSAPLGVVAVSLGGNVLCKYLGERGDTLPAQLRGAAAISAPFELARASRYIGRGFGAVYEKAFLKSLIPKALVKMARHGKTAGQLFPQISRVKNARTLWEFDDVFTAPLHGFKDASDYYTRSSSLQYLSRIRRPTLLLSAVDDPFLPSSVLNEVRAIASHNPALETEFPPHGGHVGFTGGLLPWKPFYYGEWRAAQFLADRFAESAHTLGNAAAVLVNEAPGMIDQHAVGHANENVIRRTVESTPAVVRIDTRANNATTSESKTADRQHQGIS